MATKGLSFENPLYQDANGVPSAVVNPFGFQNAAASSGSDALRDDLSSLAIMGAKGVMAARQNQFTMPEMKQPPSIGYSPSRKEFFVQGTTFSSDDAQSLLQAEGLLGGPSTGLPTGGDWMPLDPQSYGQLVQNVRNPSLGTLAARSFGRGVDTTQMLAGRGLQLAGAEQLGGRIVEQQMEDLRRTAPYERQFTDIESGRGAVEWLVANFAQQGPNMIESIATAGLGFLAGTAASGTPIGGAAAAFSSLLGKAAWKEGVKAALSKQTKGEALNVAEQKLLREAAGIAGAVAASYGQNLATGAADIYGELREQGAGAEDTNARLTALAGSVPYALFETLPEFLLAGRVLKGVGAPRPLPAVGRIEATPSGSEFTVGPPSAARRGLELLRRGAVGFGIGGAAEGTTELAQESLLLRLSDQEFGSPENVNRLINSFAAGFGIGGPIGAVANLRSKQPANLLNAAQNPDPAPTSAPVGSALATIPPTQRPGFAGTYGQGDGTFVSGAGGTYMPSDSRELVPAYSPVTPLGAASGAPLQLGGPAALGLPGPGPVITPMGGPVIMAGMGPNAVAYQDQMLRQQGNVPPGGPGTQGVLDVFGGQISAQELATRMQPQQLLPGLPAPTPAVQPDPRQGALQFAGAAPTAPANTQMGNQLQVIQDRIRRQREFEAAQAQQAALIQQQTEALAQQSANARDLYDMQQAQQAAAAQQTMPMRQAGPTQPVQLDLFNRRQAPVPSRAEGLRRGVGTGLPASTVEVPQTAAQRRAQVPLITQEGQPSMAALKSAGRKETVKPAPAAPKAPVSKPRTQRGLKKQAGVAAVEVKETPSAVQKRGPAKVSVRQQPKAGEGVRVGDDAGGKAAPKGEALKAKGKKQRPSVPAKKTLRSKQEARNAKGAFGGLVDKEAPQPPKAVAAPAAAPAVTETPAEVWDAMDTGVEWTALSPEQQTRWTDSDRAQNTADTIAEDVRNPQTPEALWEDMKPEGALTFDKLLASVQVQWRKDVDAGKATMQRAEEILGDAEETPLQLVNDSIIDYESDTGKSKLDALKAIVYAAFFVGRDSNVVAATDRALNYFNALQTATGVEGLLDSVRSQINGFVVESANSSGKRLVAYQDGGYTPWFKYAMENGLLGEINAALTGLPIDIATKMLDSGQLRVANLPADTVKKYKASVGPVSGIIGKAGANIKNDTRSNAATVLSDTIKQINTYSGQPYNATKRAKETETLRAQWKAVQADSMEDFADQNGVPLSDYFDADGNPNVGRVGGQFRVGTEEITAEVQARREQVIAEDNIAADEDYEAPFSLDDWNTGRDEDFSDGRYFRDDGTPINNPIPMGRVKMLVSAFLSKLGIKPKVQVYRDQADFKAKNPKLYAQAVASRPQGDFDTASAVGFSFGDGNVIIFADRVATEQQLKFVLAHETLGHFGFRGLLTERELNAALDGVYNSSAKVKAAVDTAMKAREMSRQEATEEYLADFAGVLDTNVLARFWNAIKNALNKIGVTFEDDTARYLVSQSRRYVRNGTTSGTFMDFKAMAQRMAAIEGITDPDGAGRFALASENYSAANMLGATEAYAQRSFNLFDLTATLQKVKDAGINLGDTWERVKSELQTVNFASRENQGYRALYNILRDTGQSAARLRAKYNQMMDTVLSPAVEVAGRGFTQGATKEQIDTTSAMLRNSSAAKFANLTDTELRKMGSLVKVAGGVVSIDPAVLKALQARGRFTLEQFKKGFTYTTLVSLPATEAYRTGLRTQRDAELAAAKTDEERKAINKDYTARLEDPSMEVPQEQSSPAMPDLTDESPEWIMYNEVRDTMDASAIDLLLANYTQAQETRKNVKRKAAAFLDRALSENDEAFLTRIEDKYTSLYTENSVVNADGSVTVNREARKNAEDFIKKFNTALLGRDTDRNADVQEFFDKAEADDVFAGIEGLKADSKIKYGDKDTMFSVQQAIANIVAAEESRNGAEQFAKRSIAGGYVPFGRSGSWQVRVQAVDPKTGRIYKVSDEYRARLFFAQTPTKADSINIAASVQAVFDRNEDGFEMEVLDGTEYVIKKVKLVAQPETARQTVSTTAEANLNEILAAITRFSISITPAERERLLVGLTTQNARARSRLQRKGTPGEDPNTIKYVSEHLESNASVVARKQNRHRLDRLFDESDGESRRLWRGDKVEYDKRKAAWEAAQKDPTIPEAQRLAAKREFDDYHFTFVTNKSEEQGNKYIDRGRRLVNFMEAQTNVDYTDFGSGETVSTIRTWTTFAFMGASFATAVLNYVALATNVFPALMGYNQKNAFGGGFGLSMSSVEITRAMAATKGFGQSEVKFWDDILTGTPDEIEAKAKAAGFTVAEARFMQKEVSGGVMQAALTNSLIGSARGKFRSGSAKKGAEVWMGLFNYTEQHSRRATGLAAFRMAYARALVEGKDVDTAFEVADKFAVDMIDNTLGEYAMFNRPAMFRGGIQQFLFMFKMFPVNSVQMLAALPRQEQLLALGILALFSGLKGLPFAEDLMDLLDTIAQTLGLGPNKVWKGSAEKTLAEALDAVLPGMTPVLMRGVLNTFTPANVADRVSLSNIIPGTGIGLAGADVGRELIEIAGPVASFLQGAAAMSANVTRYGLETVGVLDDKTSLTGIARESPVAMLRALGDMVAYNNAGAIVSQKGYVVSEDLHLGTMLTRALGFYPASAVAENDVVRLSKRIGDYQKDVAATYRGLYVSAKIAKDNDRAREISAMVKDWNEAAKGTGLEIRNFEGSANRALQEAQRTATERFLRTQPKAMRPETERFLELYGVTE
jgi:hypothetical protein